MDPDGVRKPYVTKEGAAELALKLYGLRVHTIEEMVSFDSKNFHIKVEEVHCNPYVTSVLPDGYTLKVVNTSKSSDPEYFESMHQAMKHLGRKGLPVPQPIPDLQGKTWSMQELTLQKRRSKENDKDSDTGLCGVHLIIYLPGVPMSTITYTSEILYQCGYLLAEFHNAILDFSNDFLANRKTIWSLERVPEIINFLNIENETNRQLVLDVLKKYPEEITPCLQSLPKGYIHGDFNENNVLASQVRNNKEDSPKWELSGIIDLEDIHRGIYAWDVGMTLAYASLACTDIDPIDGMGYALAGYLRLRLLTNKELSLLKIFAASRLCQSLVLCAYSYTMDPENAYIIITARTGWVRLRQLWNTPNDSLLDRWKNIRESL